MTTIARLLRERVEATPEQTAIFVRRGTWMPLTWREVADDAGRVALALQNLGVARGDRVVLVSPNRYEWLIADLGMQLAGIVHVPVHASLSGPQIAYQVENCEASAVLLSGPEQAEKLSSAARDWPQSRVIVAMDPCPEGWERHEMHSWSNLLAAVDADAARQAVRELPEHVQVGDLATILYTSGTTGEPKGVMLSQGNLASNACSSVAAFGQQPSDRRLTWLPLSHIFARTCDLYTWLITGSELVLAESPESVLATCRELQPTLLNGVPYFFEKVQRGLLEYDPRAPSSLLQAAFGGRLRAGISGGAPLPDHVADFYQSRGVNLTQGYGMTESSPVITTETAAAHRLGSVGRAIPGVEVKLAEDGEVLTRGPHVMLGYWKQPAATAEVIRDGWLHTGDLGRFDDGFLFITGRKKELIVTAAGKNIAPVYLESLLKTIPLVAQAVVIGDRRSFLTALIVPDFGLLSVATTAAGIELNDSKQDTGAQGDGAQDGRGQTCDDDAARRERIVNDDRVQALYAAAIAEAFRAVSRYEQIGAFTLLAEPFNVESGELTASLKLRRGEITRVRGAAIEAMYQSRREPPCG